MFVVGVATGLAQVVQLSPVEGVHKKVVPLLTCRMVESPGQRVESVAVITGAEFPPRTKCAMMLSPIVSPTVTAESFMLGSGV